MGGNIDDVLLCNRYLIVFIINSAFLLLHSRLEEVESDGGQGNREEAA